MKSNKEYNKIYILFLFNDIILIDGNMKKINKINDKFLSEKEK